MDLRVTRGAFDLFDRRPGTAIGDVVVDRIVEQHGVLRHDPDRAPQRTLAERADVLTVDKNSTFIDVIKTEQQPRQG